MTVQILVVNPSSSISNVHILDALKMTKSRRRSKLNITKNVKYMTSTFGRDAFFIFPHADLCVLNAYGKAMDGMNKIYDSRCIMKTLNVQKKFGLTFWRSTCASHLQCPMPQNSYEYLAHKLYRLGWYFNHSLRGQWWTPTLESRVQCKVCHSPPTCFVCYARIKYVHSQSPHMYPPRCSQPHNGHRCVFKVSGHNSPMHGKWGLLNPNYKELADCNGRK